METQPHELVRRRDHAVDVAAAPKFRDDQIAVRELVGGLVEAGDVDAVEFRDGEGVGVGCVVGWGGDGGR